MSERSILLEDIRHELVSLTSFQQDLRNGMTIHDALCKHGLTFRQAVLGVC